MIKLTEKHPLAIKYRELENFLEEKGLALDWDGYHLVIEDVDSGVQAFIRDADNGRDCMNLPYLLETLLIKTKI
jgi:hypothetical protein